jgi:hypothetical protein
MSDHCQDGGRIGQDRDHHVGVVDSRRGVAAGGASPPIHRVAGVDQALSHRNAHGVMRQANVFHAATASGLTPSPAAAAFLDILL